MDAWIQKRQIPRWLGSLVAAMTFGWFTTAMPAQAVEAVAPIYTNWCAWGTAAASLPDPCIFQTPLEAIQVSVENYIYWTQGGYTYLQEVSNNGIWAYFAFCWQRLDGSPAGCTGTHWGVNKNKVCPVPTVNPTVPYTFNWQTNLCEREAQCPVTPLSSPPFSDACATVLENIHATQAQKDAACGTLTTAMQTGKFCLASKLANLGTPIPLVVTADIRNVTYQAHLREIWDKMERLVELMEEDPAMQTACATRRAEIAAEKGCDNAGQCVGACNQAGRNHCLRGRPARPSQNDAQHTQGNAIDVSLSGTITPLQNYLNAINPPQNIQQFLDAPTDCNLNWGGTFIGNPDPVHFYAR